MTHIRLLLSGLNKEDRFPFLCLSVLYAGFFLFLNIFLHVNHGMDERAEFFIFVHGWITVPVLTITAVLTLEHWRQHALKGNRVFYPILILANLVYGIVVIGGFRLLTIKTQDFTFWSLLKALDQQIPSWQTGEFISGEVLFTFWQTMVGLFFVVNGLALGAIKLVGDFLKTDYTSRKLSDILYLTLLIGLGFLVMNFSGFRFDKFYFILAAALLAFVSIFHSNILNCHPGRTGMMFIHSGIFFLTVFLIFDPGFTYDRHHQNHMLGPVADLMNGKAPLVDINCQYGVGIIYFLKWMFAWMPFSYQGFNFLVTLTYLGLYLMVYILLRYLFKSVPLTIFTFLIVVMTNFLATIGEAAAYPSIGALRFGLPYFILLSAILRNVQPRLRQVSFAIEAAVVAVASVWSFEAFVYTIATYLAIAVYEWTAGYSNIRQLLASIVKRLSGVVVLTFCVHLWLAWDIHSRSGQWPHWPYYFDYIFLYSTDGLGGMLIAPWTPWLFFVIIPLVSFLAIFYKIFWSETKDYPPEFNLVAGLGGLAVGQFTYFLGRSHPNNLFHISIPVICLAAFWLVYASRQEGRVLTKFYPVFVYGCYFAAFFLFLNVLPLTAAKIQTKLTHYAKFHDHFESFARRIPTDHKVAEAVDLVEKFAGDKSRVAIFLSADDTTEVLMFTRKTHVFPFNYALQANLLKSEQDRVVNFAHSLKEGDIIFISKDYSDLQARVVFKLQKEFRFVPREITPEGIVAFELRRS